MDSKEHWESVYEAKAPESVSWYAPHLDRSLTYIRRAAPDRQSCIIDVGGGESTLVDDLLAQGYRALTVLDISEKALEVTRQRLGQEGASVQWLASDVLEAELPFQRFDVWHDRAVFHFLTSKQERQQYVRKVLNALRPGGMAIVATFGPDGPEKCSGLPVSRYSPGELHGTFGEPFQLLESSTEVHRTPWGSPQQFIYCFCRRTNQ